MGPSIEYYSFLGNAVVRMARTDTVDKTKSLYFLMTSI